MKTIRHLKVKKGMNFNEQFITKWKERVRKEKGVYFPLINISKLFRLSVNNKLLKYNLIK